MRETCDYLKLAVLFFVGSLLAATGCDQKGNPTPPANTSMEATKEEASGDDYRSAMREGRWEDAKVLCRNGLLQTPDDVNLLTALARATAECGNKREASLLMAEVARLAAFEPPARVDIAIRTLLDSGETYAAIELLEDTLVTHPLRHETRRRLIGLLGEAGRTDLMPKHFEQIVRDRRFDLPLLIAATDTSLRRFPVETMKAMFDRNPSDHRVRLAEAKSMLDDRRFREASVVLREILSHHPNFAPAFALLGRAVAGEGKLIEDTDWVSLSVPSRESFAAYWLTLADMADQKGDVLLAAQNYYEATQRNVNEIEAWSGLTRALRSLRALSADAPLQRFTSLATAELISGCQTRSDHLLELRTALEGFSDSKERSQTVALKVAEALESLGRNWEAEAWAAVAITLPDEPAKNMENVRKRIVQGLQRDRSWVSTKGHHELQLDRASWPRASSKPAGLIAQPARNFIRPSSNDDSHLQLSDETMTRQLKLPPAEYPDISSALIHTFGTGGGTLDLDLDGWPDLMLACAGGTMGKHDSASGALLRNQTGTLIEITQAANAGDSDFGQGVAIGDYNEDGFPDVFMANLGTNRLLRNNGDGTFTEAADALASRAKRWTTNGAFVDLDSDGLTDLVCLNYCDSTSDIDKPCRTSKNQLVACHPKKYPPEPDRILINDGTGTFENQNTTETNGVIFGRGLGVVAGNLDGKGPAVMAVNDMSPNHLYRAISNSPAAPRVVEEGMVRGVAVDGRLLSQGSMGIASGDFDGDGDLDFYVTGFVNEYNIYYEQQLPGFWSDTTARQRLVEPTLMKVGFGTHASDLDADGISELLVTNGHTGDFGEGHAELEQPFQLFRRRMDGRFGIADVSEQNAYLRDHHVGRCLWTIDVNADLAEDFVITHQNEPPRLLVNRTKTPHRRIAFRLVGRESSRDAVGAVIQFQANDRLRRLWSLSGSGYMCSNQQTLHAGLGNARQAKSVQVTWPSGMRESFGTLRADQQYLLVEGTGVASVDSASDSSID